MTSTIPVHRISSDEDDERPDLISRINKKLDEKFKSSQGGCFTTSASEHFNGPKNSNQEFNYKSDFSRSKEIFRREFEPSDDELPDINDATILSRNLNSSPELCGVMISDDAISCPTTSQNKILLNSKEAKLLEKEAKRKERERKREEKERLRKEKEEERMMKRAAKPGECLKYILVQIDRHLLERLEGSEIVSKMIALEIQYKATEERILNSISFLRIDPLTGEELDEKELIIILLIEDFISLIFNQIYGTGFEETLCNRCSEWKKVSFDSKITLIICGLDEYYKSQKKKNNKASRENQKESRDIGNTLNGRTNKRRKNEADIYKTILNRVTRIDVETALVAAQIEQEVNVRLFESPSKIADFVGQIAKAVAERPYKLDKSCNDFSWHAESSNTNCVKIDKNGEGLLRLWHQQIRQFTNVGPETAQAIAKNYPSPQCLLKAYRELSSSEGIKLLADIPVRRGVGVLANTRKVGIELSKKIYKFFMEEDPDICL